MPDSRRSQLAAWATDQLGLPKVALKPASSDASFRRYFRLTTAEGSLIAMDASPDREDTRVFVHIAGLLQNAGVHAPEIVAHDRTRGFVLLEDLGTQTYLDVLNDDNADRLFEAAIATLIQMQSKADAATLPTYDQALLRRELNFFPEWYLARHLQQPPSRQQCHALEGVFRLLEESSLAQPQVFVHRDFMPRNLMLSEPNPGVIDFQDAVRGPVSYDALCLFKDAYRSWPEARVQGWLKTYWSKARRAGIPIQADWDEFQRALDWMGMQRHLKVIGIFARLNYRDGKGGYLEDIPRFFGYIREVGPRYPEFATFMELLDSWAATQQPGTFVG